MEMVLRLEKGFTVTGENFAGKCGRRQFFVYVYRF